MLLTGQETYYGPTIAQVEIDSRWGEHIINIWGRENGLKLYAIGLTLDPHVPTSGMTPHTISPADCTGVVGPPPPKGDYQWLRTRQLAEGDEGL